MPVLLASDVILAQLACPLSDIMFCLHSGKTNLSLYKHCCNLHFWANKLVRFSLANISMEHTMKILNICLNTKITFYSETSNTLNYEILSM